VLGFCVLIPPFSRKSWTSYFKHWDSSLGTIPSACVYLSFHHACNKISFLFWHTSCKWSTGWWWKL